MNATVSALLLASPLVRVPCELLQVVLPALGGILTLMAEFRAAAVTPAATADFELRLQALLRELGRVLCEWAYNHLEPDEPALLPAQLCWAGEYYQRVDQRPRRGTVGTLFGSIRLARFLYRPLLAGEPSIFPLEINLGIAAGGSTPALAVRVGWLATANTQQQTLAILRQEHGVSWSVNRLRAVIAGVAESLGEQRHAVQVARVLELLKSADLSRGSRRIVLSVGRDGVFTPIRKSRAYQEAAVATIAVYDRAGKRLGTVYLGRMPEPGQGTLSEQLTRLIEDVLRQWTGPLPRLCYVTDAGHHPTEYFRSTLEGMSHPRTGQLLVWEWVVDYFHVCGYVSKLAEAIFGEGKEAAAWARRMRRWLKTKSNGALRILRSAAALKTQRGLRGPKKQYADAYRYLRQRLRHLNYVSYRRRGLPIGSGVTEAACKTVVTWRLKQSGMTWHAVGGQTILDLRILRLSDVWQTAANAFLAARPTLTDYPRTNTNQTAPQLKIAA